MSSSGRFYPDAVRDGAPLLHCDELRRAAVLLSERAKAARRSARAEYVARHCAAMRESMGAA